MPVHDWTRVDAGLFHAFHQNWISSLCNRLNSGGLPSQYFALAEQNIRGPIPDVLTLRLPTDPQEGVESDGGIAVAVAPPRTRVVSRNETDIYAELANIISVRHRHGNVVAVIEIVSPGNKGSRSEFRTFIEKSAALLRQKVHLLIIDLFPPGNRDPEGFHKPLPPHPTLSPWGRGQGEGGQVEDYELPADKRLTLASYDAGPPQVAYVENIAVGDELPELPLFLKPDIYVPAPLEETYRASWEAFPKALKGLLE